MYNLIKTISILLVVCSFNTIAAQDKSTLLLSNSNDGYGIDFLNTDGITALQFDVAISGVDSKSLSLDSCVSGLPKTHSGVCKLNKKGNIRVIVFSITNAVLESGNIGTIKLNGLNAKGVSIDKVLMGTPDMKEINGNVIIDIGFDKPLFNENLSK